MNHGPDYEADWPTVAGELRMPALPPRHGHDADRYNGAMLRTDPKMARLFKAYTKCDEANRDELIRLAELACTAPGGIV